MHSEAGMWVAGSGGSPEASLLLIHREALRDTSQDRLTPHWAKELAGFGTVCRSVIDTKGGWGFISVLGVS